MATLIQRVAQMAYKTFSRDLKDCSENILNEKIANLRCLVNAITAKEVNFDNDLVTAEKTVSMETGVAPVTYIHLWDDEVFSLGIFVLKRGSKLPLHDHPGMFGFCKVIHGCVNVKSYSCVEIDGLGTKVNDRLARLREVGVIREGIKLVDRDVTTEDDCVLLTPSQGNIHEISAINGPAAFLDLLAPPYDDMRGLRVCHYFRDVGQISGASAGYVWLEKIPPPTDYWCDSAPYKGPPIKPDNT